MGSLAVVVLTGDAPDDGALAATLASVRAEAPRTPVLALSAGAAPAPLPATSDDEILAAADTLALIRPGDRWRPGALAVRRRTFDARPEHAVGIAAHVLVDAAGSEVLTVNPPAPPFDPAELLLRPSAEAGAVLLRTARLDAAALRLLCRPGGDAVLWSQLMRQHGLVPSWEVAAEIPLDPARHGTQDPRTLDVLLAAAVQGGDDAGVQTVRRELLRRLYLDTTAVRRDVDLTALLGDRPAEIVGDLQWVLERLRDALAAERVRWPDGELGPGEDIVGDDAEDIRLLHLEIHRLHAEIGLRDCRLLHLDAEVQRREARLRRLASPSADGTGA